MSKSIPTILVTKDILCKKYLSRYSNLINTGNIDKLFLSGIDNLIMAAPCTGMSWLSMFSGNYIFEIHKREKEIDTVMDVFKKQGKQSVAIVGECFKEFFKKSNLISRNFIVELVKNVIWRNLTGLMPFKNAVNKHRNNHFIWIHLPHFFFNMDACISEGTVCKREVLNYQRFGHTSETMMIVDRFIKWLSEEFPERRIIFTGDHGEAQGENNHFWYTNYFDESIINLPLVNNDKLFNSPVNKISSINLKNLIFNQPLQITKYILSESGRPDNENKKLMLVKNNWKYIFNYKIKSEKLFNLDYNESFNFLHLVNDSVYHDPYKNWDYTYRNLVPFKNIDLLNKELNTFRKLKNFWATKEFSQLKEGLKNG